MIAFNIWKLAQETFRNMDRKGFSFSEDTQVLGVITEMTAFLMQIADRMVHGHWQDEERERFINAMAGDLVRTMQANQEELHGPGDYSAPFIATLNDRLARYAECTFDDEGPGYALRRLLAENISEIMATTDNKWVIEHVMEIECPEAVDNMKRLVTDVVGLPRQQA